MIFSKKIVGFLFLGYLECCEFAIPFINVDGRYRIDRAKGEYDVTNDKHDKDKTVLFQNILS